MGVAEGLDVRLEEHRIGLTGYCYRLLGSGFEAEDAVQEAFVRAWQSIDGFQGGRASLKTWVYAIATNVCFDMLRSVQRRARPMDLSAPSQPGSPIGVPLPDSAWVQPIPSSRVLAAHADPAELAAQRETVRLAFVAALQQLPPKQRAVLSSCVTCCAGKPTKWPICWTRRWPRSTARCNAHGPLWTVESWPLAGRWTMSSENFSAGTSTPLSGTTWKRSPRCCTKTRPCPCRRSDGGCAAGRRSGAPGWAAPTDRARARCSCRSRRVACRRTGNMSRRPVAATSHGRWCSSIFAANG